MRSLLKLAAASAVAVSAFSAVPASAEIIYGITFDNNLFSFDSATPNNLTSGVYVSGLQSNEFIQSIDFRPATGELFAIGSSNRVYTLDRTTGAATAVGSGFTPGLSGTAFDGDFNPTVDRIRLVGDLDQNARLNPITGGLAATDTNLAYAAGDVNFGQNPSVVAAAYDRNFVGGGQTTLFVIDSVRDVLATQGGVNGAPSPNGGQLFTIGGLKDVTGAPINVGNYTGFDISGITGKAYVHWNNASGVVGEIDLATGTISNIATMGGGLFVRDITVVVPEPATIGLAGLAAAALLRRRR